jgi:hypothetical protein
MSGDNGRAAVVGEAITGAAARIAGERAAADGDQVEAFELPTRFDVTSPELDRARRRGRPPGAVNKSTKAFRDWILARGEHPLQWMMRWAGHTPESLARELNCTLVEAFDRLKALHEGLAPYFAAKMAPTDDQGRVAPQFFMQFGLFGAPQSAGGRAPWEYLESEQNRALLDVTPAVSHGDVSHAGEKTA